MLSHKINSQWRCTFSILLFVILFNYFKSYDCKNDTTISLPSLRDYDLHTFNRFKNGSMVKHSTTTSIKPISNDKMLKLKALVAIFSISMISFMIVRCIRHLNNDGYYKSSRRLAEGGNGNRNGPSVRRDVIPDLPNSRGPSQRPPPYHGGIPGPNNGRGPLAHGDQCMVALTGVDNRHPLMEQRQARYVNQQQDDGARRGDGRDQDRSRDRGRDRRDDDRRDDRHSDRRGDQRHDRPRDERDDRRDHRRSNQTYYPPYGGNGHFPPPAAKVVVYPPNYRFYKRYDGYNPYHYSSHHHQHRPSNRNPFSEPSPASSSTLYSSHSSLESKDEPYNSRQSGLYFPRNPYHEHPLDNSDRSDRHHHSHPPQHSSQNHHSPHHPSDPQPTQESDRFPTPPPPHDEYEMHLADLEETESNLQQLVASLSPTPLPNQPLGESDPLDSTQQSGDEHPDSKSTSPGHLNASSFFLGGLEEVDEQFKDSFVPLNPNGSGDTNGAKDEGKDGEEDGGSQPNGARRVGIILDEDQRSVILEESGMPNRLRQTRGHTINQPQNGSLEKIIEQDSDEEDCKGGCCGCIKLVDRHESQDDGIPLKDLKRIFRNMNLEDETEPLTDGQDNTSLLKNEEETNIDDTDPLPKTKVESYNSIESLGLSESSDFYASEELLKKRSRKRRFLIKTLIAVAVATILFFILIAAVVFLELRAKSHRPTIPVQNMFINDFELAHSKQQFQIMEHFDFERNNTNSSFLNAVDLLIKRYDGDNWGWEEYERFIQLQDKLSLEFKKSKADKWKKIQSELDFKDAEYENMQRQIIKNQQERLNTLEQKCEEKILQARNNYKAWLKQQTDLHQTEHEKYKARVEKIENDFEENRELIHQQFKEFKNTSIDISTDISTDNTSADATASPLTTLHPRIKELKQNAEDLKDQELKKLQIQMEEFEEHFRKNKITQEKNLGKQIQDLQNALHLDQDLAKKMAFQTMKWRWEVVARFKQQKLAEYRRFINNQLEIREELERKAFEDINKRQQT